MNRAYKQEAEQYVLGALLFDNNAMDKVASLEAKHFYLASHQAIYKTIIDLITGGKAADVLTVIDANQSLDMAYVHSLHANAYSAANIEHHANSIRTEYTRREVLRAANALIDDVARVSPDQAIQNALIALDELTRIGDKSEPKALSEITAELIDRIDDIMHNGKEIKLVPTGLVDVDKLLNGGFRGGDLVVIAGRPSMGKTALAGNIMQNNYETLAGAISSIEMSEEQIGARMVAGFGGIEASRLLSAKLEESDWPKITTATQAIGRSSIYVCDQSNVTLMDIQSKARELKRKHDIAYYIVDYLQIMDLGDGDNMARDIARVTRGLKLLAKELDIPVIVLSQFNRGPNTRADQKPRLADLRDSGAIEQDADVVIAPHRDLQKTDEPTELLFLKNRAGATGSVHLTYRGSHYRFENFSGTIPRDEPKRRGFNPSY